MATFKDANGKDWVIDLDTTLLKRLKAQGVDLLSADRGESGTIAQLIEDPIFLVDTIFMLCQDQCEAANISDADFGRLVGKGQMLEDASVAMTDALADFSPRRGKVLKLAMEKIETAQGMMSDKAITMLEGMDMQKLVDKFGESLADALVSSESTQDPSSSES